MMKERQDRFLRLMAYTVLEEAPNSVLTVFNMGLIPDSWKDSEEWVELTDEEIKELQERGLEDIGEEEYDDDDEDEDFGDPLSFNTIDIYQFVLHSN